DFLIDTTDMPNSKLRSEIFSLFGSKDAAEGNLSVSVMSFGYKYGIPLEADLVFDVRFMPNPFYIPELRHKTGMDDEVYNYVFGFEVANAFLDKLQKMLAFLLPLYKEEGKTMLVVAIGCTGGHHRSVSITRALTKYLRTLGYDAFENHRDITRG
ncbi:MAG: RNase adaptor protein RapZ, partial [Oscillospiraceae bacterium]|nr:RNase adaptor protein RapZ [Oscillospiraceae bacterium]